MDYDGQLDIVWYNTSTRRVAFWYMSGSEFRYSTVLPDFPGTGWELMSLGYFNGTTDKKIDLLWYNNSTRQLAIWEMDGTTLVTGYTLQAAASGYKVAGTGDFNHDGNVDLAVGVFNSNSQVAVFVGDGGGVFAQSASVPGSALSGSLATADIDGNQTPDLVFLNGNATKAEVALGNGDGTFRAAHQVSLPHAEGSHTVSTGDLNGDGRTDIFSPLHKGMGALLFNMP
jgi:hypothetical protein